LQVFAVSAKRRVPVLVAQRDAAEILLGIGRVHGDDEEFFVLGRDDTAFAAGVALELVGELVALGDFIGEAVDHGQRFGLAENGGARIALLDGGVPVLDRKSTRLNSS